MEHLVSLFGVAMAVFALTAALEIFQSALAKQR
jgi:hypothetical protein